MTNQNFVKYHLSRALLGAVAEAEGNEGLAHLRAQTKLRQISMSDEELWELAKSTSPPPDLPVELAYQNHKRAIEGCRATASEWIDDLRMERDSTKEREDVR